MATKITASRVEIRTTEYQFSHGRTPRGFGSWAFEMNGEVVFVAAPSRTYGEAAKWARAEAARCGIDCISACP